MVKLSAFLHSFNLMQGLFPWQGTALHLKATGSKGVNDGMCLAMEAYAAPEQASPSEGDTSTSF